jgi:hypothetical protein
MSVSFARIFYPIQLLAMKIAGTILCLFLFWTTSFSQISNTYTVYAGKIGEVQATFHLTYSGEKIGGWIWFNRTPRPMPIYSEESISDSVIISAVASPINVQLVGVLSGNDFSGRSVIEKDGSAPKSGVFNLVKAVGNSFTPFDWLVVQGDAALETDMENGPTAQYFGASVWPKANASGVFIAGVKTAINSLLSNKRNLLDPRKLFVTNKTRFLAGWKAEVAKQHKEDIRERGAAYSEQIEDKVEVMYEDKKVIALTHYNYVFSGGAHGNYSTSIVNINKQTGALVSLKNVLTTEGLKALPAILEAVVMQQYNLDKSKSLEDNGLFVKTLEPSDNFYITNGNLGFLYMPYSIFPYVYGEPNIFIPASLIGKYLKPEFK